MKPQSEQRLVLLDLITSISIKCLHTKPSSGWDKFSSLICLLMTDLQLFLSIDSPRLIFVYDICQWWNSTAKHEIKVPAHIGHTGIRTHYFILVMFFIYIFYDMLSLFTLGLLSSCTEQGIVNRTLIGRLLISDIMAILYRPLQRKSD